jgi:putative two-component system response regulator
MSAFGSPADPAEGRVFVVDDDPDIRTVLTKLLVRAGYRVESFAEGRPVLDSLKENAPDLVLLDLELPDRSGHEILEEIRSDPATRLLPVVVLTGHAERENRMRAIREGVTDFLVKPIEAEEFIPRVRSLVTLKQFADEHEHAERVILTLARTIDARDAYTAGHSGRVAEYADRIAERMGLEPAARSEMRRGALFHDLGKIVIPDAVLKKPGRLDPDERRIIEQHPSAGYELLSPMRTMRKTLPIVRHHHEHLDGSGYPDGISGKAIPIPVRIVTIADIFDALTSDRAFREALSIETAYEILSEGVAKGWWDGDVLDELRGVVSDVGVIGQTAPL